MAVEVGREGIGDKYVGSATVDIGAVEDKAACPSAVEAVGDGDGVDGDGVDWGGNGVGTVGVVESVGIGPLVGGTGDVGGVELYAFGEEEDGVVGPDAHVEEGGVANDFGSGLVGAAGSVGEVDGVGAIAEAVEKGVADV